MSAAISTGAAVLIGAGVAAAATVYASNQASSATTNATNAAIGANQTAQEKQQALNQPYADIGTGGAIAQYKALLGLGPQGSSGIQSTLAATPGYQFAKTQGITGTENAATSMGLGLSGNTLEALDKFGTGLADSTYQNAVGNAQNAVTIGQNAAAGTGAGILQTAGNVGNALINQGNTIAGIDANEAAGITKAIGGAGNNLITLNTLKNLSPGVTNPGGSSGNFDGSGNDYAGPVTVPGYS